MAAALEKTSYHIPQSQSNPDLTSMVRFDSSFVNFHDLNLKALA